jgi:hypothetical protein
LSTKGPYHNHYPQRRKALTQVARRDHQDRLGEILHDGRAEKHDCPYTEYLHSQHWQIVRQRALKSANKRCSNCGDRYALRVHHLLYNTLWREHDYDVIVLCDTCHNMLHGQLIYP